MLEGLVYALILASIPAAWNLITTLPFTGSLNASAIIALRVLGVAASLTVMLQKINPLELAYLSRKIGVKEFSLYSPLLWKVTPHVMKDAEAAISISSLKGEEVWKGLAITFVAIDEYNKFYEEGLNLKRDRFNPLFTYSKKETIKASVLLGIGALTLTALLLVFPI